MINVVLYEPEIPTNTGNIMRTCAAFNMRLFLIEPLGFILDDKHLKRSAMDYGQFLDYHIYPDYDSFYNEHLTGQYVYFTRYSKQNFNDCRFNKNEDIYLVFGKESTGIDKNILRANLDKCYRIPMIKEARSLNLANTVAIGAYECLRQVGFDNLSTVEYIKGEDFLTNLK